MLNRSIFEDVLLAHWVRRHPDEAPEQIRKHERYSLALWREALELRGLPADVSNLPTLADDERKALHRELRGKTWTGLTLYALAKDVEPEWADPLDRRLLWQVFDVVHRFNNLLLHQTAIGLNLAGRAEEGRVVFDVGPTDKHILGALLGAFWTYSNLASIALTGDVARGLEDLYGKHLGVFVETRLEGDATPG